jgi:hypothetical protein
MSLMPETLPSALLLLSCGMVWNAARLFHGRKVLWVSMSFGPLSWMMLGTWPWFAAEGTNRVIPAALIVAAYTFLTAAELWRERRKALITAGRRCSCRCCMARSCCFRSRSPT